MTLRKSLFILLALAVVLSSCGETTLPENTDIITTEISVPEYPIESILFPTGKENFSDVNIGTVQNLYVAEDNPSYVSVDGVIFTKDLKTLVAFPVGRTGEYTIPDGTETIGFAAFRNCSIDSIHLPDSVSTIRDKAFSGCMQLKELSLPRTLKVEGEVLPRSTVTPEYPISGLILRMRDGNPGIPDPSGKLQKIFKELAEIERAEYGTWIDGTNGTATIERNRFGFLGYEGSDEVYMTYSAAYLVEGGNVYVPNGYMKPQEGDFRLTKRPVYAWTFPMDTSVETICSYNDAPENVRENLQFLHIEESQHGRFVSIDGVVFTKDRKTLVAFPAGRTGHYTVPDGVETIGEKAFFCTALESITIPGSVQNIHESAFADRWLSPENTLTLHFAVGETDAAKLLSGVMGDYICVCREVKAIAAEDVAIEFVSQDMSKTEFLLSVGDYAKTIEMQRMYDKVPTVYVEDLTADGYPEVVLVFVHESNVRWSIARVLDGVTLDEYTVDYDSIMENISFIAGADAFYIDICGEKHRIKKSRFTNEEKLFDYVVTQNFQTDFVKGGKLHRSLPCQFSETEFYGTLEIDFVFENGKFVYETSEYVTQNDVQTPVTTDVHITTDSPITTESPVTTSTPETTPLAATAETKPPEAATQPAIEMADEIEKQAIDAFAGGNFDFTHSIKYPRIVSENPGAIALNEKIKALYAPIIKKLRDGKEENELYRIGYNAAYTGKDYCTLMLHFTEYGGWQYSEGGESQRFFYYDGTNDRELTIEEYLESMNVDLEKALEGALWSYDLASAGYTADYDGESELTGAAQYRLPNSDEILSTAEENTLYYQRFTEFADSVALDGAFVQSDTVTLYFRGQMYTQDTFTCVLDRETLEPIRPNYEGTIELTAADVDNIEISFKDGKVISATAPAAYADSRITVKAHKVNIYSTASFNKATLSVNGGVPGSWGNAGGSEYNFYYDSYGRNGIYIEYDKLESIVFYLDPADAPPVKTAVTYVRDAYSIYNGGKLDIKQSVTYPMITTGTVAAENFNAKVAADYDPIIKSLEDGYDFKIYNIDYTYTYEDGAASFVVDQEIGRQGTEGGYVRKMYYFDVKNDRELTMDEYAARFDIDMEKAKEGVLASFDLAKAGYAGEDAHHSVEIGGEWIGAPSTDTLYYLIYNDFNETVTLDGVGVDDDELHLYYSGHAYISNIFKCSLERDTYLPLRPNYAGYVMPSNQPESKDICITFESGEVTEFALPSEYEIDSVSFSASYVTIRSYKSIGNAKLLINGKENYSGYSARYDENTGFSYSFYMSEYVPMNELETIVVEIE